MLTCHITQGPDLKTQVIESLIDKDCRWIVSDLETKFWMQSVLRGHHSIICSDHVLRASELWQNFLLKIDPEWQILPPQLAQFLIEKWMIEILNQNEFKLSNKDCRRAYQTIGQILPLLSHFQGADAMNDWFAESEAAKERWYDWYQMGLLLWQRFLEKKLIPMEWMKAVLLNEPVETLSQNHFVFDLGLDIDDVESELILNLSRGMDVDVIIPESEIENETYSDLISRCQPINYERKHSLGKRVYKKFPSQLSEVKEAVTKVRTWLDDGVEASDIAIVSPAIENYWPTLSEYLEVEGVEVDKSVVTPLSQFEIYQSWLAKMRLSLNEMKLSDGQQIVFSEVDKPIVNYDKFVSLFTNVYEIEDYSRLEVLQQQIPHRVDPNEQVSFDLFLKWSIHLLDQKDWWSLVKRFPDFDEVMVVQEKLSYKKWLEFFENYFSRTEEKIKSGQEGGVAILLPSAALNRPFKKIFVMGLSENNITEKQDTALHWTDIESIKIKFGFNLPHADRFKMLDKLRWLDLKNCEEIYLSLAETDFSGQFQAPSLYWLKGAIESEHTMSLDSPGHTRWDQLMGADPFCDWSKTSLDANLITEFLKRDRGDVKCEGAQLPSLSLSASSLEEYFKCPFRFFAQKGLGLSQLPSLDLDIDYMTRGRLIHKICEDLLASDQLTKTPQEIEALVEHARAAIDMPIYNNEIWSFLKPFYLELTQNFIKFELEWRNKFPKTKTLHLEKSLKTKIALAEDGFHFSEKGEIPFRGVIDRIDSNGEGQVAILDYKTSGAGLRQYGSWLKNGKLQLALYSLALMEGVAQSKLENVVGAFYYVMKGLERSKGFVLKDADSEFLPSKKMSREDLDQLLLEMKEKVGSMVRSIINGETGPEPHEDKICETCEWNKICRYPQLNH